MAEVTGFLRYPTAHRFSIAGLVMTVFWMVLILAILVVAGNALILLRTAKLPRVPSGVKPQPDRDDD